MLRRIFTVLFFKVFPHPWSYKSFFSLYISFSSSCFVHFAVYLPYLHCQTPSSRGWFLSVLLFFNLLVHAWFSTLAPLTPWPDNSLFWGTCSVYCRIFSLFLGLYPLDARRILSCDNQKCLQAVPWGTKVVSIENHCFRVLCTEQVLPICLLHKFYRKFWLIPQKETWLKPSWGISRRTRPLVCGSDPALGWITLPSALTVQALLKACPPVLIYLLIISKRLGVSSFGVQLMSITSIMHIHFLINGIGQMDIPMYLPYRW